MIEGCAFALRDVLRRMDALGLAGEEIRVVGGGARSELWLQIKADVTGRPVQPVLSAEPTAAGAAILAGVAAGHVRRRGRRRWRGSSRLAPRCYEPILRTRRCLRTSGTHSTARCTTAQNERWHDRRSTSRWISGALRDALRRRRRSGRSDIGEVHIGQGALDRSR